MDTLAKPVGWDGLEAGAGCRGMRWMRPSRRQAVASDGYVPDMASDQRDLDQPALAGRPSPKGSWRKAPVLGLQWGHDRSAAVSDLGGAIPGAVIDDREINPRQHTPHACDGGGEVRGLVVRRHHDEGAHTIP